MSFLSLKQRLTKDRWIGLTRREIGYGMQFLAVGLAIGYGLGHIYGRLPEQLGWLPIIVIGLILVGGRIIRS
jgi:hypothetical protein